MIYGDRIYKIMYYWHLIVDIARSGGSGGGRGVGRHKHKVLLVANLHNQEHTERVYDAHAELRKLH